MKTFSLWGGVGIPVLAFVIWSMTPPAHAYSGEATDSAFGALLSMPQARPSQGRWIIPEEFALQPKDERQLIAHLKKMKRQGADLNAVRHRGTLLDHAIRSGLDSTAIWLLEAGSQPHALLPGREGTAGELAVEYKRTKLVKLLEQRYASKALRPEPVRRADNPSPSVPVPASAEVPSDQRKGLSVSIKREENARDVVAKLLGAPEFQLPFKDEQRLPELIRLVRDIDGGLAQALDQLPRDIVRDNAHRIVALISSSGYVQPKAAATGCLLSTLNSGAFKSLWPEFQRVFADARERAPGLVLNAHRLSLAMGRCDESSSPDETAAKLRYLYEQGVRSPVSGLKIVDIEQDSPSLFEVAKLYVPGSVAPPRWVSEPLECKLELNSLWFDALRSDLDSYPNFHEVSVRAVQIPGHPNCGLYVYGRGLAGFLPERYGMPDDTLQGPVMVNLRTSCPELQYFGAIWVQKNGVIHKVPLVGDDAVLGDSSTNADFQIVRHTQTGKRYLVGSGDETKMACYQKRGLPSVYEILDVQDGLLLNDRRGDPFIEDLLLDECGKNTCGDDLAHTDVLVALSHGRAVYADSLIDEIGTARKAAYFAAVYAKDSTRLRELLGAGIRPAWTVEIFQQIADSGRSLDEKRRLIEPLLSDREQLRWVLDKGDRSPLGQWLADAHLVTVLEIIREDPWRSWHRLGLGCDIDHALGFLCGGGIEAD